MTDKLMCLPNDDTQNLLFCRVETDQNSLKVSKVDCSMHKTLGTSVINNPMSPPSLVFVLNLCMLIGLVFQPSLQKLFFECLTH